MSDVPLPPRNIEAYVEGERGTYPLYKDGYTADQMHAHAAAVSADLREENARLREALQSCEQYFADLIKATGVVNGRTERQLIAVRAALKGRP